jgi:hypothetical protein
VDAAKFKLEECGPAWAGVAFGSAPPSGRCDDLPRLRAHDVRRSAFVLGATGGGGDESFYVAKVTINTTFLTVFK